MKYVERFFRYVFWAVLTTAIAWVVRKAFQRAARQSGAAGPRVEPSAAMAKTKELFRDPVCGTYVAEELGYSLSQGKEILHFCSRECMEHFRAGSRLAAGAGA